MSVSSSMIFRCSYVHPPGPGDEPRLAVCKLFMNVAGSNCRTSSGISLTTFVRLHGVKCWHASHNKSNSFLVLTQLSVLVPVCTKFCRAARNRVFQCPCATGVRTYPFNGMTLLSFEQQRHWDQSHQFPRSISALSHPAFLGWFVFGEPGKNRIVPDFGKNEDMIVSVMPPTLAKPDFGQTDFGPTLANRGLDRLWPNRLWPISVF